MGIDDAVGSVGIDVGHKSPARVAFELSFVLGRTTIAEESRQVVDAW